MFRIISDSYLGFCCWDGLDQVWVLGEGHMQLWKQKKKVIIWWKTPRTFWCKVQLLQLWTGASVCLYWHNVYWFLTLFQCIGSFIEVFLEVMMILTLSHFENQLHPSRHTNASSHAVDPFFCSVRGSFGKKMKKKHYQCQGSFSMNWRLTGTLWLSNKTLVYDSQLLHSNVQPLTHIKEKQA